MAMQEDGKDDPEITNLHLRIEALKAELKLLNGGASEIAKRLEIEIAYLQKAIETRLADDAQ